MCISDGKIMVVYHKDTGKMVEFSLGVHGDVILPKELQKEEENFIVSSLTHDKVDWETNYVLLN